MTGKDLRAARRTLGEMWGLGRPIKMAELGRILRLRGQRIDETIHDWERGSGPSGPASVAIEMMLAGAKPPGLDEIVPGARGNE